MLIIGLGLYFLNTYAGAYKACTTLAFVDDPSHLKSNEEEDYVDVESIIKSIPYSSTIDTVFAPKPGLKYAHTILLGRGNCSNMSFGLIYKLLERGGSNYQIVHMLSPSGFLQGKGHTVLNMPFEINHEKRYGIVDIFHGGLPTSDNQPITIEQLRQGN